MTHQGVVAAACKVLLAYQEEFGVSGALPMPLVKALRSGETLHALEEAQSQFERSQKVQLGTEWAIGVGRAERSLHQHAAAAARGEAVGGGGGGGGGGSHSAMTPGRTQSSVKRMHGVVGGETPSKRHLTTNSNSNANVITSGNGNVVSASPRQREPLQSRQLQHPPVVPSSATTTTSASCTKAAEILERYSGKSSSHSVVSPKGAKGE